jgi:hypothetical protein
MEDWKEKVNQVEYYLKLLKGSNLDKIVRLEEKLETLSDQVMENKRNISELQSVRHDVKVKERQVNKNQYFFQFQLNHINYISIKKPLRNLRIIS